MKKSLTLTHFPRHLDLHADGFDVVAECTGVEKLIDDAINYVRRGGSLLVYGVYEDKALVHWPPGKIFGDEINVSFHSVLLYSDMKCSHVVFCMPTPRSLDRSHRHSACLEL